MLMNGLQYCDPVQLYQQIKFQIESNRLLSGS